MPAGTVSVTGIFTTWPGARAGMSASPRVKLGSSATEDALSVERKTSSLDAPAGAVPVLAMRTLTVSR